MPSTELTLSTVFLDRKSLRIDGTVEVSLYLSIVNYNTESHALLSTGHIYINNVYMEHGNSHTSYLH